MEPSFNFHWQSYKKIIQQRNSAIRQGKNNDEIQLWNTHLITHGEEIHNKRKLRLETLLSEFRLIYPIICPDFKEKTFALQYKSGWAKELTLQAAIEATIDRDRQLGYTRSGPHAADWSFKIDGYDPSEILSRGQQKLFFIALCMAQIKTTQYVDNTKSILLIDDISSELDRSHQMVILEILSQLQVQTFITSTDNSLDNLMIENNNYKKFHVKHGEIV